MRAPACPDVCGHAQAPVAPLPSRTSITQVIPRDSFAVAGNGTASLPVFVLGRIRDYVELTKPRVAVLVLFTVGMGALLAPGGISQPMFVLHALLGTALVAAGASALNQYLERHSDARMQRTENRPLPSGRLQASQVLLFGIALGAVGVLYLALMLPQLWAALIAAATFVSYVFVYTPLKRKTTYNTLIGAVPGALPPLIGWAAMPGAWNATLDNGRKLLALVLVLLCWQVPHFMAIAWLYRAEYARAGLRMVPVNDPTGRLTSRHMVLFCLALIPASLLPVIQGSAGPLYLLGALGLGLMFLLTTLSFRGCCGMVQARRVLRASLIYLPALLLLLLVDMFLWRPAPP